MQLRRLTTRGIEQFGAYLDQLKADSQLPPPDWLLTDDAPSEPVGVGTEVAPRQFATRLEAGAYLDQLLTGAGVEQAERDAGLWSWLTLFYFDQVCPVGKGGKRDPGEQARYIPQVSVARRSYRHMLLGPWTMYRIHRDKPERLLALLSTAPHIATSETYRLFIENPSLIACAPVVDVATQLYFDFQKGKIKRGAGRKEAGGCRRLIEILQQLDCTYDLALVPQEKLLKLLPDEFRPFLPKHLPLAYSG